jgi:uncharacterized tellurite resistance protein B-like protein
MYMDYNSYDNNNIPANNGPNIHEQQQRARLALYVYTCLAQADGDISVDEMEAIIRRLHLRERYLGLDINSLLAQVLAEQRGHSAADMVANLQQACQQLCHTEADRHELMRELEEIMEADGLIKNKEMEVYRLVRAVLEQ